MSHNWLKSSVVILAILSCENARAAAPAAPPPAPATQPDPANDRLTFLTLQLSSAEESIKAINTALRVAGYKAAVAADKIEGAEKGNELMDRKGGAPVPWDQFYGKTARSFLAPAPKGSVIIVKKGPGETLNPFNDPIKRPKQFDYLYRANAEQAAKARQDVAAMGKKIETLLARRRQLEAEQVALWTKIAIEALGNREMAYRPIYRFKLKPAADAKDVLPEQIEAMRVAIALLRTADKSSAQALEGVSENPEKSLSELSGTIQKSVGSFQEATADVIAKGTLNKADTQKLKDLAALGKRMQLTCKNIADARRLAGESDVAADEPRKLTFRAQLQESLVDFSEAVADFDSQLMALAEAWNIQADTTAKAEATSVPAAVTPAVIPGNVTPVDNAHTGNFAAPTTAYKKTRKLFVANERAPGNLVFTDAGGPYEIAEMLTHDEGVKRWEVKIEAGAEIRGGRIELESQQGRFEINGDPRRPAVLKGVTFVGCFHGGFRAKYAIFEDCKFLKGGRIFNTLGYTSRWEFEDCHLTRCVFPKLTHVDYGFKFADCTFVQMEWPAIVHPPPKDKPQEMMDYLRKDWNVIDRCQFESCSVTPLVYWCAQYSNFDKCKFVPGQAFESDTETQSLAYVTQTAGDPPDKVFASPAATRAAIHMIYADKPFPVFAFPTTEGEGRTTGRK